METIRKINAEEILDSRGNPTIKATISSENFTVSAEVPSGASTGAHEAMELRDDDKKRYNGKGVLNAIKNIENVILPSIIGMDPLDQQKVDRAMIELDGTDNKSNLGGNATIGVSLAVARLASTISRKPLFKYLEEIGGIKKSRELPYLQANLINGGEHAETSLPFQEYHIIPNTEDINEALEIIFKMQNSLKKELRANIGDEGGFVTNFEDVEGPLKIFSKIAERENLTDKLKYSLDVAASSFFDKDLYNLGYKKICASELLDIYKELCRKYPILSIEDPFHEDDFTMFTKTEEELPGLFVIGDDLTVTNKIRLQRAIDKKSISGLIIKPNQIGTLTEVFETMNLAREHDVECIISHRSGETNDTFIADLAVATGAFGVKFGALQRGERVAKYNRLKEIFNY
jgi:enolase